MEVCVHIDPSKIADFGEDLMTLIETYSTKQQSDNLIFTLNILGNFFTKTTVENVSKLKGLIVKCLSLISYDGEKKEQIHNLLSNFLTVSLLDCFDLY